jgi:hypothetical protein
MIPNFNISLLKKKREDNSSLFLSFIRSLKPVQRRSKYVDPILVLEQGEPVRVFESGKVNSTIFSQEGYLEVLFGAGCQNDTVLNRKLNIFEALFYVAIAQDKEVLKSFVRQLPKQKSFRKYKEELFAEPIPIPRDYINRLLRLRSEEYYGMKGQSFQPPTLLDSKSPTGIFRYHNDQMFRLLTSDDLGESWWVPPVPIIPTHITAVSEITRPEQFVDTLYNRIKPEHRRQSVYVKDGYPYSPHFPILGKPMVGNPYFDLVRLYLPRTEIERNRFRGVGFSLPCFTYFHQTSTPLSVIREIVAVTPTYEKKPPNNSWHWRTKYSLNQLQSGGYIRAYRAIKNKRIIFSKGNNANSDAFWRSGRIRRDDE